MFAIIVTVTSSQSGPDVQHLEPAWRKRSNFIIAAGISGQNLDSRREQLWAQQVSGDRFVICCIPFFAYNIALGDTVETAPSDLGQYVVRRVTTTSERWVFRAWFGDSVFPSEVVARELHVVGALVERSGPNHLAIDACNQSHARVVSDLLRSHHDAGHLTFEAASSASTGHSWAGTDRPPSIGRPS